MTTPWTIRNVLVATDMSKASLPALRYARLFAGAFGAKLLVVYSDPIVYPIDTIGPSQAMFIMRTPDEDERLRSELVEHARCELTGRDFDVELTAGQPIDAILESATERSADLIVTGTHLREGWRRLLLGSVSDAVQHRSRCPVLTVRSDRDGEPRIHTIVCPIDAGDQALAIAVRLAELFEARLTRDLADNNAGLAVIGAADERFIRTARCPVLVVPPVKKESTHENQRERSDRDHRRRDAGVARTV